MKGFLAFLLTLCLMATLVPFTASAATEYTDGYYTYTVTDGEATITNVKTSISGDIVIPSTLGGYPVTSIGNSAFFYCTSLTSIDIPEGVTSIGSSAFYGCTSLTSIEIPNSVTSIDDLAFYGCTGLTNIDIPDGVTSIGNMAFSGCSGLTSVHISSIESWLNIDFADIAANPLYYAENLYLNGELVTEVIVPDSITEIKRYAFYNYASLTSIDIPSNVTSIGDYAFWNCTSLTSIDILDGVTSIGNSAFSDCSGLTSVTIGENVTSIGHWAFVSCVNLKNIEISDNVTSIGEYAFYDTAYYNKSSNWENGVLYIGNHLIEAKDTLNGDYEIKVGTKTIASKAFKNCTNLTSIEIPDSVTSIPCGAFEGCANLKSMTIPFVGGSRKTSTDTYQYPFGYIFGTSSYTGGVATTQYYYGSSTSSATSNTYYIPKKLKFVTVTGGDILYGAFSKCTSLASVTIGNGATSIGVSAFYRCTSLTSIEIPDSVTSIDNGAFAFCSLTSIDIPDSVTSIGSTAFYECTYLTSITIPDSITSIGESAFAFCYRLNSVTIGNGVTSIEGSTFYECTSITSIDIPDSVTSIGDDAFYNCTRLTSIEIPDSVTSIGSGVFYNTAYYNKSSNWANNVLYIGKHLIRASTLSGAYQIKEGTKTIASEAFENCTSLTSITIPDSVTSIGYQAFAYCTSLTSITIPDSVMSIGVGVFGNCTSLTSITVDKNNSVYHSNGNCIIETESKTLIVGCTSLTSIDILDNVTSIGDYAFYHCNSLTTVTIGNGVMSIGSFAFYDCDSLTDVWYTGTVEDRKKISIDGFNDNLTDATWHYETCSDEHTYLNGCNDSTCENCEWTREVPAHTYGVEWLYDKDGHWQKCAVCEHETDKAEHNVEDGVCKECGKAFYTLGDVDGEEGITANDAIYLLYNVFFGEEEYPVDQPCDFDGDNSVTANDAIYLLYHVFFGDEMYPLA